MASALRHGFKTAAERRALQVRHALGLTAIVALNCFALAVNRGIPMLSLVELERLGIVDPQHVEALAAHVKQFKAVTVSHNGAFLVVYNHAIPADELPYVLAHEFSHILLGHEATVLFGVGGCRKLNPRNEEEADWQAGTLLVPREGALWAAREGLSIAEGAAHFKVSEQTFRWRMNMTGASRMAREA